MKFNYSPLFLLLFVFLLPTSVDAQWGSWKEKKGSGDIEKQERSVDGNFTEVKSCCSMEVRIRKGSSRSVTVETDDNLLEYIITEVSGDRLRIRTERNVNLRPSKRVKVYITMPTITGLDASSSSDLIVEDAFRGDELDLDVSSSAEIKVNFTGSRVDVDGSSSGKIELRGSADRASVDISSSCRVNAADFMAKEARVEASSSGRIEIGVSDEIRADVSSSGRVNYRGTPNKVITDASSGGKVSKME